MPSNSIDLETTNELRNEHTKTSEKIEDDLQYESESIASALAGGNEDDGPAHHHAADLEKTVTQHTQGSTGHARRIVTAVDWTGPDDPGNPLNWRLARRAYQTAAIGSLAFAVTFGSSIITPALPEIAEEFGISRTVAILSLTLYVLGLGFGPVFAAPISETYGRECGRSVTSRRC